MQIRIYFLLSFLLFLTALSGQNITITGIVQDENGEGLAFATVTFPGTTIGTTTDIDGNYTIETDQPTTELEASFLGYEPSRKPVGTEAAQTINFKLGEGEAFKLEEVVVTAKKGRYRKKNNPAVALIRNVIKNKKRNRLEGYDYYQHDVYEKIEMDLTNISDKFKKRRLVKKVDFIFDYVDSTKTDEKPSLPFYFQENAGTVYYRKSPKSKTEFRDAQKITKLEGFIDDESLNNVTDKLYEEVDIYENNINLFTAEFISPLSPIAPDFYAFYIQDTLEVNDVKVIDLSFIPRNKQSLGFEGNLYVAIDSSYRVMKVDMGIVAAINLNFVRDVNIVQEFNEAEPGKWVVSKNNLLVEYSVSEKGMGFYGRRSVINSNFVFNQPADDKKYGIVENVILTRGAKRRKDDYWEEKRPEALSKSEAGTYVMIDSLQKVPAFKRAMKFVSFALSGYTDIGPFDLGPVNSFYSFNPTEGFRARLGGRTNLKFHPKFRLEGYGAYGFRDKKFKYQGLATYSFNSDFEKHPRHFIRLGTEHETRFPGQEIAYFSDDNFFLSFKRGNNTRMILHTAYTAEYFYENKRHLYFWFTGESRKQEPYGTLEFNYLDANNEPAFAKDVQTTEAKLIVDWSPNAQYLNGKTFRIAMQNRYPSFLLTYKAGLKGILGGDHRYHNLSLKIHKKFQLSLLGMTRTEFIGGKVWGKNLPYILLDVPPANQSIAYALSSFNTMNYLEFSSDQYVSWNIEHYFKGFFLNRIPLLKRLKLREIITFKGMYGSLSDANNPNKNPHLIQFLRDENGKSITTAFGKTPFMEAGIGFSNIFKLFRVDLVKRLTYLDNPDTPNLFGVDGLTVKARIKVEF